MRTVDILSDIRQAIAIERDGLNGLLDKVGEQAERAVVLLHASSGRVIVTGVGKTGLIGRKIAATLASTGTPALYLHPSEAIHGDLGVVQAGDVVLVISNSGESSEIVDLMPYLAHLDVRIIALTGVTSSTLAKKSDVVIDVGVEREADPLGLAPTASTTAALAMGDAIAAALMALKKFSKEQYARNHPGGSLGNVLHARVKDLMIPKKSIPLSLHTVTVREAIFELVSRRLGATFIVDGDGKLAGIFTDGDLGRLLQQSGNSLDLPVADVMIADPKRTTAEMPAIEALRLMEDHAITLLPVVDDAGRPVAAIHMHDLVKAGLALWSATEE